MERPHDNDLRETDWICEDDSSDLIYRVAEDERERRAESTCLNLDNRPVSRKQIGDMLPLKTDREDADQTFDLLHEVELDEGDLEKSQVDLREPKNIVR